MTYEQTKEYLKMMIELEKNKLIQENTIYQLKQKFARLGKSQNLKPPKEQNVELNITPHFLAWGFLFGLISTIVACIIYYNDSLRLRSLGGLVESFQYYLTLVGVCFGSFLIGGLIFGGVFGFITSSIVQARRQSEISREYKNELQIYYEREKEDEKRVNDELIEKRKIYREIEKLEAIYDRNCLNIKHMYSYNIIPDNDDYRGLVPVCMFYQYLDEKQTYSLERNPNNGDPGAIRLYIEDQYQEKILTKLDVVIEKLDKIIDRQNQLYYAINDACKKTEELNSGVINYARQIQDSVKEKTIIDHYDHQQLLADAKFQNNMDMIYGKWS